MENEEKLITLLESIEKTSKKQLSYARYHCFFSVVTALCCLALLVTGITFLPKIAAMVSDVETIILNLETVTTELTRIGFSDLVNNINSLVGDVDGLVAASQTGVEQAMSKINGIDFDTLNKAIQDLSDVIEPLVKVVKKLPFVS